MNSVGRKRPVRTFGIFLLLEEGGDAKIALLNPIERRERRPKIIRTIVRSVEIEGGDIQDPSQPSMGITIDERAFGLDPSEEIIRSLVDDLVHSRMGWNMRCVALREGDKGACRAVERGWLPDAVEGFE